MKVLFISNLFPDSSEPQRGLDNSVVLQHLAEYCDIRVISPRPTLPFRSRRRNPQALHAPSRPVYPCVPYVPKIGSRVNHVLLAWSLRPTVEAVRREFRFDVVLCSWAYPDACAVARLVAGQGIPFIAIAQGTDVHTYGQHPVRRRLIVSALAQANAVITRSRDLASRLQAMGVPRDKLHPIYNGVDSQLFRPGVKHAARAELQLPIDADIILFVGNFYEVKDPLLTVEAHARFVRAAPARTRLLVMIGGGPMEERIRAKAKALAIESLIVFAGRQPPQRIARTMQAADCLLLNSHNEGVPNVILEAISCGLPAVATKVGGIPEVIDRPERGRCVEDRSATGLARHLEEVIRQQSHTAGMKPAICPFDWRDTAMRYRDLLRRAAECRLPAPPS